jgi:hypothetical protein
MLHKTLIRRARATLRCMRDGLASPVSEQFDEEQGCIRHRAHPNNLYHRPATKKVRKKSSVPLSWNLNQKALRPIQTERKKSTESSSNLANEM